MSSSDRHADLLSTVAAHLDRLESQARDQGLVECLEAALWQLEEAVEELLFAHTAPMLGNPIGSLGLPLERLGHACEQLEEVLAELEAEEPIAADILDVLTACSMLAIAAMDLRVEAYSTVVA